MMNPNRVSFRTTCLIERAAHAVRIRGKTGEGEISTAPARALLAHPGEAFSLTKDGLRCAQPRAGA